VLHFLRCGVPHKPWESNVNLKKLDKKLDIRQLFHLKISIKNANLPVNFGTLFVFVFLVCTAATQLALQLHQERIQVVRSNKVVGSILVKFSFGIWIFFYFLAVLLPHS